MIAIVIQLDCNGESSETQKNKTWDDDYQIEAEKMLKERRYLDFQFCSLLDFIRNCHQTAEQFVCVCAFVCFRGTRSLFIIQQKKI